MERKQAPRPRSARLAGLPDGRTGRAANRCPDRSADKCASHGASGGPLLNSRAAGGERRRSHDGQ